MVGDSRHFKRVGASGSAYQLEVDVFWDDKPGGQIRVAAGVDDGGLRAFFPVAHDFLVPPGK